MKRFAWTILGLAVAAWTAQAGDGTGGNEEVARRISEWHKRYNKLQEEVAKTGTGGSTTDGRTNAGAAGAAGAAANPEMNAEALEIITMYYKKATEAEKEGNKRAAMTYYTAVINSKVKQASKLIEKSREKLIVLEDEARKMYEEARQFKLVAKYSDARTKCIELTETYPLSEARKKADAMLSQLASEPQCASAILYDDAFAEETAQNYGRAMEMYRSIVQRYANTLSAIKADGRIQFMNGKEEIVTRLRAETVAEAEKRAPAMIQMAKNLAANGQYADALESLNRILFLYPDTDRAKEAAALKAEYEAAQNKK